MLFRLKSLDIQNEPVPLTIVCVVLRPVRSQLYGLVEHASTVLVLVHLAVCVGHVEVELRLTWQMLQSLLTHVDTPLILVWNTGVNHVSTYVWPSHRSADTRLYSSHTGLKQWSYSCIDICMAFSQVCWHTSILLSYWSETMELFMHWHIFNLCPHLLKSIVHVIRFITNRKYTFYCIY